MNEIKKIKEELIWADEMGVSRPDLELLRNLIAYVEAAEAWINRTSFPDTIGKQEEAVARRKNYYAARAKLGLE